LLPTRSIGEFFILQFLSIIPALIVNITRLHRLIANPRYALAVINRTKEISSRKVLGASVTSIVILLAKDFLRPVAVAFAIAAALAWFLMNRWLQDFDYRIQITAWVFATTGAVVVLMALSTVSLRSPEYRCLGWNPPGCIYNARN
jgi:hypothetical protein